MGNYRGDFFDFYADAGDKAVIIRERSSGRSLAVSIDDMRRFLLHHEKPEPSVPQGDRPTESYQEWRVTVNDPTNFECYEAGYRDGSKAIVSSLPPSQQADYTDYRG
jgi:hypothetical protein